MTDLVPSAGDPAGLTSALSRYPAGTVISAAGTWLGSLDAGLIIRFITEEDGRPSNPFCGVPFGSLLDAGLSLGPPEDFMSSRPDPAIYFDATYWTELQRRNTLVSSLGMQTELDSYRQAQPAHFPLPEIPASLQCDRACLNDRTAM
jgi:hypothetical protein